MLALIICTQFKRFVISIISYYYIVYWLLYVGCKCIKTKTSASKLQSDMCCKIIFQNCCFVYIQIIYNSWIVVNVIYYQREIHYVSIGFYHEITQGWCWSFKRIMVGFCISRHARDKSKLACKTTYLTTRV